MKTTLLFVKISMIVKHLFDAKTQEEMADLKAYFGDAYTAAQLCALVLVGMVLRVFGLAPEPQNRTRSIWTIVGLLMQFLKSLDNPDVASRALSGPPNPLDAMVNAGLEQVGEH